MLSSYIRIGLKFWKASARKFFIVPEEDLEEGQRGAKRVRVALQTNTPSNTPAVLPHAQLQGDIDSIKATVEAILSLSRDLKIPLGLKRLLTESFQCYICHRCMKPPIIMAKCCKSIVGCEDCINGWYSGPEALTKYCPRCRCERGYNETMRVLGLDDFLTGVRTVIEMEFDA